MREREQLDVQVVALEQELLQHEHNVESRSSAWLEQINHVVNKLAVQFTKFMRKLQYDGNVKLQVSLSLFQVEV